MRLRSLTVRHLRVLAHLELRLDADLVAFTGPNGSGKTSILEAIHLLGTGRSFRARSVQDVVSRDADRLLVHGELEDENGRSSRVGIEKPRQGDARLRLDGEDVTGASALARHMPLVVLTPDSQRLLSDGAEARRRLLDWLMFHVEPRYQAAHSRYRRALRQRNAALRGDQAAPGDWVAWCEEMGAAGGVLENMRSTWLDRTLPALEEALSRLSRVPVTLHYQPGWDRSTDLATLLRERWTADRARGYSQDGPHRVDLQIRIHGRPAQHVASRGEGKVLAAAVHVGFAQVLAAHTTHQPVVLVDELASELDSANRARFGRALRELGLQTFVTAVTENLVDTRGWERVEVYRMGAGQASRMVQ